MAWPKAILQNVAKSQHLHIGPNHPPTITFPNLTDLAVPLPDAICTKDLGFSAYYSVGPSGQINTLVMMVRKMTVFFKPKFNGLSLKYILPCTPQSYFSLSKLYVGVAVLSHPWHFQVRQHPGGGHYILTVNSATRSGWIDSNSFRLETGGCGRSHRNLQNPLRI